MKNIISYSNAQLTKKDFIAVQNAIVGGWGANYNRYIKRFEKKFSKKINVKYGLATSSCTGAIHLAISSLNLKKGSEVILADTNWVATLSPLIHLGLKPILVDVDIKSWCIDPIKIDEKINKNTSLIIATHLYGNICDMKKILKIAKRNNIYVLEDSAESLGSKINNKYCGTIADIGCFSFHGSKTITTGEGGMLVTNNKKLYEKSRILNEHGRTKKEHESFTSSYAGYKFKMTSFQAALGMSQLENLESKVTKKRKIFHWYKQGLKDISVSMNIERPNEYNSYWMTNIVFDKKYKINIKSLIKFLKKKNIETRPFFPPLSKMRILKKKGINNKNSIFLHNNSINLPSSLILNKKQIFFVCNEIKAYLNKNCNGR